MVGFSFKLPQGVDDVDNFWDVLETRTNLSTDWPEDRINVGAVKSNQYNKVGPYPVEPRSILGLKTMLILFLALEGAMPGRSLHHRRPGSLRCPVLLRHGQRGGVHGPTPEMDT